LKGTDWCATEVIDTHGLICVAGKLPENRQAFQTGFISKHKEHLKRPCIQTIAPRSFKKDFHFHDLRHTCATRMIQGGVDLYKVQRLLGHKSPIMTQRYAHHYPESLRDGVEALEVGRGVSTKLAQLQCP
jgi:integrase